MGNDDEPIDGVDEIGVALAALATTPVYPFSDDQLMTSLDALEHHRRLLDATTSHLLAELDRREVPDRRHGLSTTSWYAREAQLPGGVARRRLIDARALSRKFFDLDTALAKGECGLQHASTIIEISNPRIANDLAALTPELIALIPGRTFRRWRQDVENIARLLDQDGDYSPEADESANRLSISPVINGERNIRARLVGSWAETVQQAIETVADELAGQYRRDAEHTTDLAVPDRSTLRALALVEICRRAAACDRSRTSAPTTDLTVVVPAGPPLPGDMRLPPGFDGWADSSSSAAPDPVDQTWSYGFGPPSVPGGSDRPGAPTFDRLRANTFEGVRLADDTSRMLLCDSTLHAVITDSLGVPIDLGSAVRFATAGQRRAARVRDGGCIFPGCEAPPRWCDLHHVTRHPDGPTDLHNLASLCRRHHRVAHRRRWAMQATGDGWFWWTTSSGDSFWSQRHGNQRAGPAPSA